MESVSIQCIHMTTLHTQLREELKVSLKAKDAIRLLVVRGLLTAFTNELVSSGNKPDGELSDVDALNVITRAAKQRKDSIEQFRAGGREDLVKKEEAELVILEKYLPTMMGKDEIKKIALAKKEEFSITERTKIGILMGAVMKDLRGKADGADVKEVIDSLFT